MTDPIATVLAAVPGLDRYGVRQDPDSPLTEADLPTIEAVRAWLRANVAPIKRARWSSYYVKHVAERALGGNVTNGQLIAAAVLEGYPFQPSRGNPNVWLGMDKHNLDAQRKGATP